LHLEECGKINLRRWSNVNHNAYRKLGTNSVHS
jgi:hypothetical protein